MADKKTDERSMTKVTGYTPETFRVILSAMMGDPHFKFGNRIESHMIGHSSMCICWESGAYHECSDVISVWFYPCGGDEIVGPSMPYYAFADPEQAERFIQNVYDTWCDIENQIVSTPEQKENFCSGCDRTDCIEKRNAENRHNRGFVPFDDTMSIGTQMVSLKKAFPDDKWQRAKDVENAFRWFVAFLTDNPCVKVPDWVVYNCLHYLCGEIAYNCGEVYYPNVSVVRNGITAEGLYVSDGWGAKYEEVR